MTVRAGVERVMEAVASSIRDLDVSQQQGGDNARTTNMSTTNIGNTTSPPGGKKREKVETWLPTKKFKYFSPRTEKYSYRTSKYSEGMAFLLKVVLDNDVYDVIKANPMVMTFAHREVFYGEEFPVPVPDDVLDSIYAWLERDESLEEAEWVRDLMGTGNRYEMVRLGG